MTEADVKEVINAVNSIRNNLKYDGGAKLKLIIMTAVFAAIVVVLGLLYLLGGLIAPDFFFGGLGLSLFLVFGSVLGIVILFLWIGGLFMVLG